MRCTKAIIYNEYLRNNISEIKKCLNPNVKLCFAVKADGYGNGGINAAKIAESQGASYLAIATSEEGEELRQNGIKTNLLLLSPFCPEEAEIIIKNNITPVVFEESAISSLKNAAKNLRINFKQPVFLGIDTGMGRIGCRKEEAAKTALLIAKDSILEQKGIITHFAVSDSISKENIEYTKNQLKDFLEAIEEVKNSGINPGIRTVAASAAGIAFKEAQLDMIRPGIIYYGYYPDEVTKEYLKEKNININLIPPFQFETQVAAIRHFVPGQSVSYGRTWVCTKETDIAVLPVGYADGLLRRNSPAINVTINGKLYPIVGRICMDQCMVDIGKDNPDVKQWDKVIIFGPKTKGAKQDADDIARKTGTISYEVMTAVSKRVKRFFIN